MFEALGRDSQYWPAVLISFGGCCFGIMDVFAKLLVDVHGIPTAPVIFSRMLVTAVLASSYLKFQGVPDPILGPKEARGWLVARGAVGIVNVFLFYNSLRFLPVGDALSIWFTAPIITSVLAALLLKEPYTLVEASCGLVSLVGVVCVVHPPTIFGSAAARPADQAIGFVLVTGGTVAGAIVFVIIRHIGKRADALFSVSYFGYMAALAMGFLMLVEPSQRVDLDQLSLSALFYLVGLSLTGFLATYCQNLAIQLAKVGRITLLLYVQLPLVAILSWLVFGDVMSLLTVVGCLVIIACAITIALSKEVKTPEAATKAEAPEYVRLEEREDDAGETSRYAKANATVDEA